MHLSLQYTTDTVAVALSIFAGETTAAERARVAGRAESGADGTGEGIRYSRRGSTTEFICVGNVAAIFFCSILE